MNVESTSMWHEERLLINGELRSAANGALYDNISAGTGYAAVSTDLLAGR
jgi:hypothetical protein